MEKGTGNSGPPDWVDAIGQEVMIHHVCVGVNCDCRNRGEWFRIYVEMNTPAPAKRPHNPARENCGIVRK